LLYLETLGIIVFDSLKIEQRVYGARVHLVFEQVLHASVMGAVFGQNDCNEEINKHGEEHNGSKVNIKSNAKVDTSNDNIN
jgi:hypothetical protein